MKEEGGDSTEEGGDSTEEGGDSTGEEGGDSKEGEEGDSTGEGWELSSYLLDIFTSFSSSVAGEAVP